jgi:regulator of sigma E protease
VHELGHYWVARRCGVRVETFSIGFGRELCGWTDAHGTRWKIGWLPLGGYVKMFGDADAASAPDAAALAAMTPEQRRESFQHQGLLARAAIVVAGPLANFAFAVLIFAGLFLAYGRPFTPPIVAALKEDFPAARAGILPGDRVVSIDGRPIERFEQIQRTIMLSLDQPVTVRIARDGRERDVLMTPVYDAETDRFGNVFRVPRIGIRSPGVREYETIRAPWTALWRAVEETWSQTTGTLTAVGQMISGRRTAEDLGGPLRIAKVSGEAAQMSVAALIQLIGILSVSLGLINLMPIPMLDGGHLVFYLIEWVRGRPLGAEAQEFSFRVGMVLVVGLMLFATWQDLVHVGIVKRILDLVS